MIYYKKKSCIEKIRNIFKIPLIKTGGVLKTFFKFSLIFSFSLFLLFYLSYLLFFPKFICKKNAQAYINNYLSKNSNITFNSENLNVNSDYKFNIVIKADSTEFFNKNNKKFLTLQNPQIELNFLTAVFGFIDFNKIKVEKITFYTNFTKNNRYDIFDCINPVIFTKQNSKFEIRNIHILANEVLINLYDENIKRNFLIKTGKTALSLNGFNHYNRISTSGSVWCGAKLADINLDISFKTRKDILNNYKNISDKLNYNPLKDALKLKFYSKINTELKISPIEKRYNFEGKINFQDYVFTISNITLPKNNLTLVFRGDKIITDCNFNFLKDRFIKIKSTVSLSKNKYIEAKIISNEINLQDLNTVIALLHNKYSKNDFSLSGILKADLYLKSNFKKINSKGTLYIKEAGLIHKKTGLSLSHINSNISLENNKINILNAGAFFDDAKFYLKGTIDTNTNLDIKINSDLINIAKIAAFLKNIHFPSELNNCIFKSGFLKINSQIKGNLNSPQITAESTIEKLNLNYKPLNSNITADLIKINAKPQKKALSSAFLEIQNLSVAYMNHHLKAPFIKAIFENGLIKTEKSAALFDKFEFDFISTINTVQKEAKLSIFSKTNSDNKIFAINKQNVPLSSNLIISKDKITISSLNFDNFINAKGHITNFSSKNPDFDIKILIPQKINLDLKTFNTNFFVKGSINLSKNLKNPEINGNLNINDFLNNKLNLSAKDVLLNIKNSAFYLNASNVSFSDSNFDFSAQGIYENEALILDYANIIADYINLDKLKTDDLRKNNLKYEIKDLSGKINSLETGGILFNSFDFKGNIKNEILNISDFTASVFQGNIKGELNINLKTDKVLADIILKEIPIRHLNSQLKDLSIAASGKLSALLKIEFFGCGLDETLKTAKGYIKFNINDGELAQFAKLERYLQAGNILSQSILKLSINSILSTVTKQNTGDFKTIEGTVNLENSNAKIQYIKTSGSNMSTYITGDFNLLNQCANVKVLGRIPRSIVNVLGNIGKYNLNESVDKMEQDKKDTIKSITQSALEKKLSTEIPETEADKIPPLAYKDVNEPTREFVVLINGNISSINSVKDFKWRLVE